MPEQGLSAVCRLLGMGECADAWAGVFFFPAAYLTAETGVSGLCARPWLDRACFQRWRGFGWGFGGVRGTVSLGVGVA